MAIAVKAHEDVALVERLCRLLGIDPTNVDELTLHFRAGHRPVIRVRRYAAWDGSEDNMIASELERYDVTAVERR